MNLVLPRETLLKPLQVAAGVIENKQALPILANVLIIAKDDVLKIVGTDLEIELIGMAKLPEPVTVPILLTVPCRKLLDICKALPEHSEIKLDLCSQDKMVLCSGRSRYTLATLPANEFPHIDEHETIASINLAQHDFRYLLQRTYFAMAHQDVRYFLNGLLLEFFANSINAVATDGHRLAMNTLAISLPVNEPQRIIIPRKTVLELMRLLNNSAEEVTIEISTSNIRVLSQEYQFTSKLIEGRFPDYQKAIPRDHSKKVLLEREPFKQALNRSAILSNDKVPAVYFEFKHNLLRILANNFVQESAEEELEIDYPHEELGVAFNVNYLLEVLSALNSPEIGLTISGAGNSFLIEEPNNEHSIFVVMPMRI